MTEREVEMMLGRLEAIVSLLGLPTEEQISDEIERLRKVKERGSRIEHSRREKAAIASLPDGHIEKFFYEQRKAAFRENYRRIRAKKKAA